MELTKVQVTSDLRMELDQGIVSNVVNLILRVSTTPGNLLEFVWSSWKFLCKMQMIDCIGFQS